MVIINDICDTVIEGVRQVLYNDFSSVNPITVELIKDGEADGGGTFLSLSVLKISDDEYSFGYWLKNMTNEEHRKCGMNDRHNGPLLKLLFGYLKFILRDHTYDKYHKVETGIDYALELFGSSVKKLRPTDKVDLSAWKIKKISAPNFLCQ